MRWKITIEGMDEFGGRDTAEMVSDSNVRPTSLRAGIAPIVRRFEASRTTAGARSERSIEASK